MNFEKIAIMIDSCTDVPKKYIEKYKMFVLPIMINYQNKSYLDGVEIQPNEVYERLGEEIPKTSLPPLDYITNTFKDIAAKGYERVIAITMSSGLSGTNNALNIIAKDFPEIETCVLDTKNIGIGAGFAAITAGELIDKKLNFTDIKSKLSQAIHSTKIFFCVETLEYLKKGGRIGAVSCLIGNALDLKPIISCNDEGTYYTVSKCIGKKHALKKAIDLAKEYANKYKSVNISIAHGNALAEAERISKIVMKEFKNINNIFISSLSPALGVHTGPGLIGIGVQENL